MHEPWLMEACHRLFTSTRAERTAAASPKCEKAMWPLAAFSCARMSMRIARGPTRAAKGSVVHVWLLSPCIKNIIFFFRKVKNLKKNRLRRYEIPLAALAEMLYLYKYFRFLLQKWSIKIFVACGAQNFAIFARKIFGNAKS